MLFRIPTLIQRKSDSDNKRIRVLYRPSESTALVGFCDSASDMPIPPRSGVLLRAAARNGQHLVQLYRPILLR